MKKTIALMLVLVFCSAWMCALADDLDLGPVRENSNIFAIDVDSEREIAFITSTSSVKSKAFDHKYEHPTQYSYIESDILVTDYFSAAPEAILRLWIYYAGTKELNINSVSFVVKDKKYTFSKISDKEWRTSDEEGFNEDLLIKFGSDSWDFLVDLDKNFDYENWTVIEPVKMILHGSEDIEIELSDTEVADTLFIGYGFMKINGDPNYAYPTPMKITDVVNS